MTDPVQTESGAPQGTTALTGDAKPAATTGGVFTTPPATDANAEKPWYADLPEAHHEVVKTKGWKGNADVLESYVNLEKLFGADRAGNTVQIPKPDATPEELGAFYKKLGVPEAPEGYGFKADGPLGDEDLAETALVLHKAGVPVHLAKGIVDNVKELLVEKQSKLDQEFAVRRSAEERELQVEYGTSFADKVELGKRAAREAGLTDEQLNMAERVFGPKALAKLLIPRGEVSKEISAPPAATQGNQFTPGPQQAKAKIQELFNDSSFMARYTSPNPATRMPAIEEMERWMKISASS